MSGAAVAGRGAPSRGCVDADDRSIWRRSGRCLRALRPLVPSELVGLSGPESVELAPPVVSRCATWSRGRDAESFVLTKLFSDVV